VGRVAAGPHHRDSRHRTPVAPAPFSRLLGQALEEAQGGPPVDQRPYAGITSLALLVTDRGEVHVAESPPRAAQFLGAYRPEAGRDLSDRWPLAGDVSGTSECKPPCLFAILSAATVVSRSARVCPHPSAIHAIRSYQTSTSLLVCPPNPTFPMEGASAVHRVVRPCHCASRQQGRKISLDTTTTLGDASFPTLTCFDPQRFDPRGEDNASSGLRTAGNDHLPIFCARSPGEVSRAGLSSGLFRRDHLARLHSIERLSSSPFTT
jgi:hypothetical protein